jgi:signal transduction histidine kinase/ActR/RegA family two-component response regulator
MVKNEFWGFIGFDYCKSDRIWNDNEIAMLRTTAANLGGFIEREQAKKELIEAKEAAEGMSKLKSNFLANMSHELRTPLIAILGYTEILSNEVKNNNWAEMVDTIMQSGKRLLETLNLILDLSKIEADKIQIASSELNLANEINETINLLKPFADKKNLYIKTNGSDSNITVNLDKRLFQSVITNLINNAIKYTNQGGVTVSLNTFGNNGDSLVCVKVADTGIGIAKENQEFIFDEFRQVSEGFNRNFEGSGLGLTITKKFVEKMGGTISLESLQGQGTIFTIKFPLHSNDTNHQEDLNNISNSNLETITKLNEDEKVLIIDDDPATRRIIELNLRGEVETKAVCDIKTALEEGNKFEYSLVLMDISLGQGISGVDLLKNFRTIPYYKDVPIIAVTAHAMVGDKEKFLSEGFDDYLSKPFTKTELINKVNVWRRKQQKVSD